MFSFFRIKQCFLIVFIASITLAATLSAQELPRTVAIMPFINETQERDIAPQMRKSFYNHFSSKPYRDVELTFVDEKIVSIEKSTGKGFAELTPQEVCQAIGCDGLIYGKVTDFTKIYAALYSQLGIEAEVWMVNAKTGEEVFRLKDAVKYHGGTIPISPLSLVMTAVSAAMNLREIQQIRLINELCYKLNEKIPSPEGMLAADLPSIKEVLTNGKESPFGKNKIIRVGLEGEKGLVATFDIGNFKKGILMRENDPGIYTGDYLVMPGDDAKDMPIIASLKRPGGLENQWLAIDDFITIDTTAPPQVTNLKAKGFPDRIEISWDQILNTPDLKGYRILRSEQPLSGYVEITTVEFATFEDKTAKPETVYYYRVIAFDKANNESDPQDSVKASLIAGEPVILTGELKKDMALNGLYTVKGDFVVPKPLTLTVEPGTNILFDEMSSLIVRGRLTADGKDSSVEFIPLGDNKWKGLVIEGGNITTNSVRIRGAITALTIQGSEGAIENTLLTGNETGIFISGTPSPVLRNSTITGNTIGVKIDRTDARIIGNNIFQNKEGIQMMAFSGEIKENNIFDNEQNVLAGGLTRIGPNYFGSVNAEEMRLSGINAPKVYDDRLPQGKVVDAVVNLYAELNSGERLKKAKELADDANEYFKKRNFGKASALFEESLRASPLAESYYYLALCHQEMREDEKAAKILKEGIEKFPRDSGLQKALGLIYYQSGNEKEAVKVFKEVIRLNPDDKQVKFMIERIEKN